MNVEMEIMWKIVIYFEIPLQNLHGGAEENHKGTQQIIV
jgi:hypothetical protein